MKNLEKLGLSDADTKELQRTLGRMFGFMGIKIEVIEVKDKMVTVMAEQVYLTNGLILNRDELRNRAQEVFKGFRLHVVTILFRPGFEQITNDWIRKKMKEFGLRQVDIGNNFGIDKSTLSSLLKDPERNLTRFQKSAFFYYFLTFEINKNVRIYIKQMEAEIDKK